jgi:hypothetical protein
MAQQEDLRNVAFKYYDFTIYERPEGDLNLFVRSGNRRREVIIGGRDDDWDTYCEGYRRAADALVIHLTQDDLPTRRDYSRYWESVGYTILFLYRHYLELRIKSLYLLCNGQLEAVINEHSLLRLWERFLEQNEAFSKEYNLEPGGRPEESLKDIETAGKIIAQFDSIDRKSQVFRYPIDRKGEIALEPIQFDIVRLKEMLGWASQFLEGWSIGIYECWQAELQSRYERKRSS